MAFEDFFKQKPLPDKTKQIVTKQLIVVWGMILLLLFFSAISGTDFLFSPLVIIATIIMVCASFLIWKYGLTSGG